MEEEVTRVRTPSARRHTTFRRAPARDQADPSRRAAGFTVVGVALALLVPAAWSSPSAFATPAGTPGTPNQQIAGTQAQVAQIEHALAQEAQQTALLDTRYTAAMGALEQAQQTLQTVQQNLQRTRATIEKDRHQVANDAVAAYVYGTTETGFASYFDTTASLGQARVQYTEQIVGNLTKDEQTLARTESALQAQVAQQQSVEQQAAQAADQAHALAAANAQQAAATRATLQQAQGQLAQEVAQAAVAEAQAQAATAAHAATATQRQQATAAAAAATAVAGTVGGASSGAAATTAANQAGGSPGPVGGSPAGGGAGQAAVSAAKSQLGVPYAWGGEQAGVGFDCSGLVQWAWARAGVSIPRTTEAQWPALPHVALNALEPGDLLFYYNLDGDNLVDHVVMYVGSGPYGTSTVIHAPFTGATVSYSPIFTVGLIGAARP